MEASFFTRHPVLKDVLSLSIFVALVVVGTILINTYALRSYNVEGRSMEETLYTGDRLIVNRLAVTMANIRGQAYVPERGQVIVFENPQFTLGVEEKFLVKRVIGLPGERVVLKDGVFTVYNSEHPDGFNPDDTNHGEPGTPASGEKDIIVPEGEIFVAGDHRQANYSYDSRNGLGTVPLFNVIGPVALRIFPLTHIRGF